jgi:hypothetical protein
VVFTGAPLIPLPGIVVFTGQFTLTTDHGQLKASNVYLLGLAANKSTVLAVIDPAGSTGRFAGATGTLFLNTNRVDVSGNPHAFQSEVHGEVCFAR